MAEATSARAALDLTTVGVKNVKTLLGGWHDWTAQSGEVVKGKTD